MSLKVGFVGLSANGWAASVIAPALTQPGLKDHIDIVAVSTTSPASAAASAEKHAATAGHAIKAYDGSTEKIAADEDVQFVAVSVQAPGHKEALLPVIEKGKDFFIEWPVTGKLDDALEIEKKVKEKGLRTIVGLQGTTSRFAKKIREIVNSGKIGAIRSTSLSLVVGREILSWTPSANVKYGYHKKDKGVTALAIAGGHQIAILTSILGEFSKVHSVNSIVHPTITLVQPDGTPTGETVPAEVPDHYVVAGTLASGVVVNLFVQIGYSFAKPGRRGYVWEIQGEEGVIIAQSKKETPGAYATFAHGFEPDVLLNGEVLTFDSKEEKEDEKNFGAGGSLYSIGKAWKAFAEGKQSGPDTYPDIHDAVRLHRLLAAIEESGETGKTIEL